MCVYVCCIWLLQFVVVVVVVVVNAVVAITAFVGWVTKFLCCTSLPMRHATLLCLCTSMCGHACMYVYTYVVVVVVSV